jgi:acetyl esterase
MTGEPVPLPRIEDMTIPGPQGPIPTRLYAPDRTDACPVILYLHGGGYVKGGIEESDAFCRNLARATRHMVLSIDYRLAPDHRFPAALDDAIAAATWAGAMPSIRRCPGPDRPVRGKCGGNLAAVTCLRLRSHPHVMIRHQVLLQPVIDFTLSFPSIAMPATDCLVPREDLEWYYRTYCG